MTLEQFQADIRAGIPDVLPAPKPYDTTVNHAPKRKEILSREEKVLAIKNALRYFPEKHHATLAPEFAEELEKYGRIYMYRLRPDYEMYARPIEEYPAKSRQAAAMMLMIQNNLDKAVAQHPHELITYGGNGAVFQNWAQYRLAMKYLSEMTDEQTLVMYSGHPMGLFPSHPDAPRAVITNGMVIPNYSKPDDWERMNALGVSQYGQMTAGSWMYIGPQGIVHGTTITVLNAGRKRMKAGQTDLGGMLFVSAGLGGMSGAQPKAGNIAGVVSIVAEINPAAVEKRYSQGWVDEVYTSLDELLARVAEARKNKEVVSMADQGNIVDLWERLADEGKTPLFFLRDGELIGVIAVADTIRADSREAVEELHKMGLSVIMLTGDNARTAAAIGRAVGVDEVISGVLPDGKEAVVRRLQEKGRVVMVGDGINDAPALARADVGIAIGGGTDIAIESADVVLMRDRLRDVPRALRLGRATLAKIYGNLAFAFIYNIIGIPLAAGAFTPVFGWSLSPMFGALAMSLSSFSVVTNALTLGTFTAKEERREKKREMLEKTDTYVQKTVEKEENQMKFTMKIKGMMCPHCEARVKNTLLSLEGVESAEVSHEQGTAEVTGNTTAEILAAAVEGAGYEVLSVE